MFKPKQSQLTYLSRTSEIQGNLNVEGNLRIDGVVHGVIEVRGDLEISKSGLVEGAELKARNILVHGVLKAQVIAEGQVILTRTARLEGDIKARSVDIEAGAHYVGHIITAEANTTGYYTDATASPTRPTIDAYPELVDLEEQRLPTA